MNDLVFRLSCCYQDSPQVSELEQVLGEQTEELRVSKSDTLTQLWIDTATWRLDLQEQWTRLSVDRTRSYSYWRSRVKAKLQDQGATTAEVLYGVAALFGYDVSLASVVKHPEKCQFEIILFDLTSVPLDVGRIEATVSEIKPAHLDYWLTCGLARFLTALWVDDGLWNIQTAVLPPMGEEWHVWTYHYHHRRGPTDPGVGRGGTSAH